MDAKTKAIVAHITMIGWIIALVLNNNEKDEMTSFYIRQVLGVFLLGLIGWFIPFGKGILSFIVFVLWLISLVSAVRGEMKPLPVIGDYFQDWFRSL